MAVPENENSLGLSLLLRKRSPKRSKRRPAYAGRRLLTSEWRNKEDNA